MMKETCVLISQSKDCYKQVVEDNVEELIGIANAALKHLKMHASSISNI